MRVTTMFGVITLMAGCSGPMTTPTSSSPITVTAGTTRLDTDVCVSGSANPTGLRLNETADGKTLQADWEPVPGVDEYEVELEWIWNAGWTSLGITEVSGTSYSRQGSGTFRVKTRTVYCDGRRGGWSEPEVKTVGASGGSAPSVENCGHSNANATAQCTPPNY